MTRPPKPPDPPSIEDSLRRLERAVQVPLALASRHIEDQVTKAIDRHRRKQDLRREREEARQRKAEAKKNPQGSVPVGVAQLAFAVIFVMLVAVGLAPWFMLLISLGLTLAGVQQLSRAKEQRALRRSGVSARPMIPRSAMAPWQRAQEERLERLEQRVTELRGAVLAGPEVLRDIVRKPEETFEGIRKGFHALVERERSLRELISDEEDERVARDRQTLEARLQAETDPVTRQKLGEAFGAVEQLRRERAGLATSANRLEAEQMRLLHSLDGLHAQVIRAKSAGTGSGESGSEAALRLTMSRLSEEVGAVAEALESVASGDLAPLDDGPLSDPTRPATPTRTR